MTDSLESPLMATGIGLRARIVEAPSADRPHVRVRLIADAGDVAFTTNEKDQHLTELDLLLVVRDEKGKPLNQMTKTLHLALTPEQYEMSRKSGMGINAEI